MDQIVATASGDATVKIWALADFSCVKTLEGHGTSVHQVRFLSRGMQLVSAGSDGLLKLWTIKSGEAVKTIEAHEAPVWGLSVSRDESRIVSGGRDSCPAASGWALRPCPCAAEQERRAARRASEELPVAARSSMRRTS